MTVTNSNGQGAMSNGGTGMIQAGSTGKFVGSGSTPGNPAPLNHEQYDVLLGVYREYPADHGRAARTAHVTPRQAEEAWRAGVSGTPWGLPISSVLAAEATTARAAVVKETMRRQGELGQAAETVVQQQVEQAMVNLSEVRLGEAKMVQTLRQFAFAALVAMAPVRQVMPILFRKIADEIKTGKMSVKESIRLIKDIEEVGRTISEQAKVALEMERKVFGEPDLRIQVGPAQDTSLSGPVNVDAALEEIRQAHEAAERIAAQRRKDMERKVIDTTATEVVP